MDASIGAIERHDELKKYCEIGARTVYNFLQIRCSAASNLYNWKDRLSEGLLCESQCHRQDGCEHLNQRLPDARVF